MTKHDHLESEIADVLASINGLTVAGNAPSNVTPNRPFVRMITVGENVSVYHEDRSREVDATVILEVAIKGSDPRAERNRLADAIEHAFDTAKVSDYSGEHYTVQYMNVEYAGASGVLDDGAEQTTFLVTLTVNYIQSPL